MSDTQASTAPSSTESAPGDDAEPADEFLWLEDIHGAASLAWAEQQNARTEAALDAAAYDRLREQILAVLDDTAKIPDVTKRGPYYYNFWRDETNPRGLWRRTTWASYQQERPEWEVLLDVDALAAADGTPWVFAGASLLRPTPGEPWRRGLVKLSPDGGDAVRVREFDVEEKSFVAGGFDLPAAKTQVSWVDADTIFVGTEVGPGSMTTSSYPRTGRRLTRGQELTEAPVLWEVPEDHLMAVLAHDRTPGFERDIAVDVIDFFRSRTHVADPDSEPGAWRHVDVPDDVNVDLHRQWLLFRPQTDWDHDGTTVPAGTLAAAPLDAFLAGQRELIVVFAPDERTSLQGWSWTAHHLILNLLTDVASRVLVLDPDAGFTGTELPDAPALSTAHAAAVDDEDPDEGDDYWLTVSGFLTPTTLQRGRLGGAATGDDGEPAHTVKTSPSFFETAGLQVEQHFVTSADSTRVPYFQIGPKDLVLDGANPTLLNGYGGFEISRTPAYSGAIGRSWLTRRTADGRSGVYVIANIRGGGEYGPGWHRAALQANRPRAYEDFAAVAQDLIDRGVTTREHLGCSGGSNGGLLVGNMLTTWPHLFGAISCGVPLLDMRRYTKLSAGYSWIAEYGDPDDPEQWAFIRTFSPYHNLVPGTDYPATLIYTATSDDRVGPVQARKMAARMARMEAMGADDVWFYEALEGGHAAASDNRQAAQMAALSSQFLWQQVAG
ncbi:S9 family peptidase [Tersicoccus phoenicis]|uniref:S9 family peptidase n=1 Tax=Tersicoccus phoenicis TaxID=554083 RepID=A0A1R1L7W2_9MICC|nr:prolyl oligopeptidase family serine peptidase [Tersicoccus phoenicis]OMH23539.1 S9 family peptidase [Tersicoccus phoenicis]